MAVIPQQEQPTEGQAEAGWRKEIGSAPLSFAATEQWLFTPQHLFIPVSIDFYVL